MRLVLPLLLLLLLAGCSEERAEIASASGGAHPAGWADRSSSAFHGTWLAANAFPLPRCQECHGADYRGGEVGVSCSQSGCHAQTPIACTTCHGSNGTPRPRTGAHWAHEAYCSTCHEVPAETTAAVQKHASAGASASLVHFGGVALRDPGTWLLDGGADAAPAWDRAAQRCTNTYCHGPASPQWTSPAPITCSGCHDAPPSNHAPWLRVSSATSSCASCHPSPASATSATSAKHIDGVVDVTVTDCTACHGSDGHANPPLSLAGSADPADRGVGAHAAHLDPAFPDRIASALLCNDCHVVPTRVVQPGHLDGSSARVRFPFGGTYDSTGATCTVWCHFDRTPGPVWTDDTGAAARCDSCHGFPPVLTRAGSPHPSVTGALSACLRCHAFGPTTHVNGVVDYVAP